MIKKFFWGMVFSGLSMALMQVSPMKDKFNSTFAAQLKLLQQIVRQKTGQVQPQAMPGPQLHDGQQNYQVVEYKPKIDPEVLAEATPTPAPATQNIDGKEYVMIQGKYYEYRPDNVYEINGERVFYKKTREPSAVKTAANGSSSKNMVGTLPTTPSEIMKAIQDAQKAMNDRERILDGDTN